MPILLEVCIATFEDAVAAQQGGADRLELNVGLELGGLTPTAGLLTQIKRHVDLPVMVMLRPRPGGFCYPKSDIDVMLNDAENLLAAGADGIVFGILDEKNEVDTQTVRRFIRLAAHRQTIFHRAFDLVPDPMKSAKQLTDLGVDRILTSGQQATALEGRQLLATLNNEVGQSIEILPAAGIRSSNVVELIRATGCNQIHGSCGKSYFNPSGPVAPPECKMTDIEEVKAVRQAIDRP